MRPITFAQARYLNTLVLECEKRGIELSEDIREQIVGKQDMGAAEAGELIDDLKFELGWE